MNKTANRLSEMEFDEISLVTRPANQLSKVLLVKSDTVSEDEMPEVEVEVEEEATESVEKGHGAETKMKKKKDGEMPDFIKDKMDASEDEDEDEEEEEEMPIKKGKMKKSSETEIPAEVFDYIEALESANNELMSSIEKMQKERSALVKEDSEEIFKSADPRLVELIKSAENRAVAAEQIAKAERDFRLEREYISKSQTLTHLPVSFEDFGKVLKNASEVLEEADFDAIWQVLTAANAGISKSGLFGEVGKSSAQADVNSPMSAIERAAASLRKDNPSLTAEQAISKAVSADAELYNEYIREGRK